MYMCIIFDLKISVFQITYIKRLFQKISLVFGVFTALNMYTAIFFGCIFDSYSIWLMECSHDSSRCHAAMFFGQSFPYRVILNLFDQKDGLRSLFNVVSVQL
jgi:hypothetical protein